MRLSAIFLASAAALSLAACDASTTPYIAGVGTTTTGSSGLTITPSTATVRVGATVQLSVSGGTAQASSVEWSSSQSTVAAISPSGLVTGIAAGTASIVGRLATDTTVSGSATITVTP
ncbi:MAG: Ig-like domain-containing protein [Gemmatimonadaceae bacterium]